MKSLLAVRINQKFGYIDLNGQIVVEPHHVSAGRFNEGLGYCVDVNGTLSVFSSEGRLLGKLSNSSSLGTFSSGYLQVCQHDKWGYIDEHANLIVEPRFDGAREVVDRICNVVVKEKYGIFSIDDQWVVKPTFRFIQQWLAGEGITIATGQDESAFLIKANGKKANSCVYFDGRQCHKGLCPVQLKSKDERSWGWVDYDGNVVLGPTFDDVGMRFDDGFIAVKKGMYWGVSDREGKLMFSPCFTRVGEENEGLREVCVGGEVHRYSGGLSGGKYGFIDRSGQIVIEPHWHNAHGFSNGAARVYFKSGGRTKMAYIRPDGSTIWKEE